MEKNYYSSSKQQLLKWILKIGFAGLLLLSAYSKVSAQSDLFVENLDKFPSNDRFVFSRIQVPWSRDGKTYNANHDSLTVRIHNKGISSLIIKNLTLKNKTNWKFVTLKGVTYNSSTSLPFTISSGASADLTLKFVALNAATRVKILQRKFNDH